MLIVANNYVTDNPVGDEDVGVDEAGLSDESKRNCGDSVDD